jgi:hypothetical protein
MRSRLFCVTSLLGGLFLFPGCGHAADPEGDFLAQADPEFEGPPFPLPAPDPDVGPVLTSEPKEPDEGHKDEEKIIQEVLEAKSPEEQIEVHEQIVEQQVEHADDINDELEELLLQIRLKKGLPAAPAYKAPTEIAAEQALQRHQEQKQLLQEPVDLPNREAVAAEAAPEDEPEVDEAK